VAEERPGVFGAGDPDAQARARDGEVDHGG
jgi:hypothetical protein